MRNRLEDIGRLLVMLENCLWSDLFNSQLTYRRPKDACDWFDSLSKEKKDHFISSFAYGIEVIREQLYDMIEIARGEDNLNIDEEQI